MGTVRQRRHKSRSTSHRDEQLPRQTARFRTDSLCAPRQRPAPRHRDFFGLPSEGFEYGIWIWPLHVKNRLDVDDVVPLCERNMEGLAKDWGEEKEERCRDAGTDGSCSGFAHGTLLGETFAGGRQCAAMAAWKDHGKQGMLRENARATSGPDEGRPIPLHVI